MSNDPLVAAIRASTQALGAAADALQADFAPHDSMKRELARIDACASTMSTAGRQAYLRAAINGWEHRYARFVCVAAMGDPDVPDGEPDAADYLLIICDLAKRLKALDHVERNHADNVDDNGNRNS